MATLLNLSRIMKINREELYKHYMTQVEHIAEECDWVTSFGPEQIIEMVSHILELNPDLIEQ